MWTVGNHTPFGATGYFQRDRDGAEHWVVAVVGRFDVRPDGLLAVADSQPDPLLEPALKGPDGREMTLETDLAPFRPQPDIIVSGVACLPGEAAAPAFDGHVAVGRLRKAARFLGERRLRCTRGRLVVEGPEPVVGVRLTWRNALGGPDLGDPDAAPHPDNPIGMGWLARWPDLPDGAEFGLPHIEDPAAPIHPGQPMPPPHGFGALQPAWRPRLRHAGTYDGAWRQDRAPLPPDDFSERFHQAAPEDQVYPAALDGGAPVEVVGFHADGPYGFNLPQLVLTSRTRIGMDVVDGRLRLVSMALDASARTVRLTWNTCVPCNGRDHHVTGSRVMLKQMAGVAG